jgi:transcriptional regulator with XRE-family HTH domain
MTQMIVDEQLVASRIRAALTRAGISASDAAKVLGVTAEQVEHWLTGHRRPRAQLLIARAELVNTSAAWLMGREVQARWRTSIRSKIARRSR